MGVDGGVDEDEGEDEDVHTRNICRWPVSGGAMTTHGGQSGSQPARAYPCKRRCNPAPRAGDALQLSVWAASQRYHDKWVQRRKVIRPSDTTYAQLDNARCIVPVNYSGSVSNIQLHACVWSEASGVGCILTQMGCDRGRYETTARRHKTRRRETGQTAMARVLTLTLIRTRHDTGTVRCEMENVAG